MNEEAESSEQRAMSPEAESQKDERLALAAELEAMMEKAKLSNRVRHGMEDWALERIAELRASGEPAKFRVTWCVRDGVRTYRVDIRRADGSIERPVWPLPLGLGRQSLE